MSEPSLLLASDHKGVRGSPLSVNNAGHAAVGPSPNGGGGDADHYHPFVREVNIPKLPSGACGFDLSRSKWDPYPWVSGIDKDSTAGQTGLRCGDCVLEVNGEDILGLRIAEVAQLVRSKAENVTLLLWTTGMDPRCSPESLCCGPMPLNLDRLSSCVQAILTALECPVCLDTIPPPAVQCMNGHLVCARCRIRAEKCPVCRQRYSAGRSLIAEQVFNSITEAFKVRDDEGKLREQLFGAHCRKTNGVPAMENMKMVQSHTHKFLAKIMGKATSLDGLNKALVAGERSREETTKQLSLSVNEIFRPNSSAPSSRSTSPHRLVPDLGSQTIFGSRRPRSQNVSTESLNVTAAEDATAAAADDDDEPFATALRLDIPQTPPPHLNPAVYGCPAGERCAAKTRGAHLQRHIGEVHRGVAIVSFGDTTAAVVDLPQQRPMDAACLVLRMHDVNFWVRVRYDGSDDDDDDGGEYLVAAMAQTGQGEAAKYCLEVRVAVARAAGERVVSREIVSRCTVQSLERTSWQEIVAGRDGIVLTSKSIRGTFEEDDARIAMTVTIQRT